MSLINAFWTNINNVNKYFFDFENVQFNVEINIDKYY